MFHTAYIFRARARALIKNAPCDDKLYPLTNPIKFTSTHTASKVLQDMPWVARPAACAGLLDKVVGVAEGGGGGGGWRQPALFAGRNKRTRGGGVRRVKNMILIPCTVRRGGGEGVLCRISCFCPPTTYCLLPLSPAKPRAPHTTLCRRKGSSHVCVCVCARTNNASNAQKTLIIEKFF